MRMDKLLTPGGERQILAAIEKRFENFWPRLCAHIRSVVICNFMRDREYERLGLVRKIPYWITKS
jgi:hypothetical protein